MKTNLAAIALSIAVIHGSLFAETVKDREGAVRTDREAMQKNDRWIYNDIAKGFEEAKKTGKPLLVTLRCVPCKACMGIDATILSSEQLQPLLDQFVCVRVINANALDLNVFQFDYDLSFSTIVFNADGTIYGRYGSWQHQRDANDVTTAGYKATLTAALALHKAFPANKASLAGKMGGPAPFNVPVEIPTLAGKYQRDLNWDGKVVPSCVHCHQIGDAFRATYRNAGKPLPMDLIYPMPAPDTIGLQLDTHEAAKVSAVTAGSAAATAGFMAGDDLVSLNGQPLISIADVAWVLHRAPETGDLKAVVRRGGADKELSVNLAAGWRFKTDIASRHSTYPMRAMAFAGMTLSDLPDDKRQQSGVSKDGLALIVTNLGYFPYAKNAGFQKDDVIVAIGSLEPKRMSEGELIGHMLTTYKSKDSVKFTVLRGDKRVELTLPLQ
jgi:hypothetical protein